METTHDTVLADLKSLAIKVGAIQASVEKHVKEFYTVGELAELTHRRPYTVRRWIKNRLIVATRVQGTGPKGRLLIARAELEKLVQTGLGKGLSGIDVAAKHERPGASTTRTD